MKINIREATPKDVPDLVEMAGLIQMQHASDYPDVFRTPLDSAKVSRHFNRLLKMPKHHLIFASTAKLPCAYIWCESIHTRGNLFKLPTKKLAIHTIFVRAEYRRKGVASQLFNHICSEFADASIQEIELDTWAENLNAYKFFNSQGFKLHRLHMKKKLSHGD